MLFIKVNDLVYVYDSDEILDVLDQGAIAVVEADKFDENNFKSKKKEMTRMPNKYKKELFENL